MEIFWFIIIALVLTIFFILDGYDFGTGIIHLFLAKTDKDKEVISKAAGLFWDSNEVWLVVAGGLLFMAFPTLYASVFSGFYLPLIMILWLIIFRAIGLELRGQINHPIWKTIWDKSFGVSSLLLALFFGVALGNVARGVNLGEVENGVSAYDAHYFFLPLWNSSFSPSTTHPGVLDWFTIVIGVISVITLSIHGANWIILKTNASINSQLKSVIFKLNIGLAILTIFSVSIWHLIKAKPLANYLEHPSFLIFPIIYFIGLTGTFFIKKFKKEITGFICSTLMIVGGITSTLATMFPTLLPSTNNTNPDLTIYNTATSAYGMNVALPWMVVGIILFIIFFIVQKKLTAGKIDNMDYGH